jgi:hypothetical protein
MLEELGLHIKGYTGHNPLKVMDLDDLLVDHGLLLLKNSEPQLHGHCLSNDWTRKIKVKIQGGREDCCAICKRSFTFLAEEASEGAFRKKKCLIPCAQLYVDFMELEHRKGRPSDYSCEGLDNVCLPCHYLKTWYLPSRVNKSLSMDGAYQQLVDSR